MTVAIHGPGLRHDVSALLQLGHNAHPLGHIETRTPEVDQVSAAPQFLCMLDDSDFVTGLMQPERQRRASDPGPHY